ncbi:MAG: hypothetical protein PF483_14295 [Halothiobacillus sp.]|jgi:hypothetical protein|nr:hypothetical protein [Halothiobacillus sp.]
MAALQGHLHSIEAGQAMAKELGAASYIQAGLVDESDRVRLVREAIAIKG